MYEEKSHNITDICMQTQGMAVMSWELKFSTPTTEKSRNTHREQYPDCRTSFNAPQNASPSMPGKELRQHVQRWIVSDMLVVLTHLSCA